MAGDPTDKTKRVHHVIVYPSEICQYNVEKGNQQHAIGLQLHAPSSFSDFLLLPSPEAYSKHIAPSKFARVKHLQSSFDWTGCASVNNPLLFHHRLYFFCVFFFFLVCLLFIFLPTLR
eukprot:TRINITY_DN2014_c0_g1_i2.p1 TRINITY_DN2014_c0_g1~~TRINITY_DN2014_c0_g1_i2.p1  ORF type:complete len:118 (+),score=14.25 TRINITY_DN2014_c0_g1_i2:250-603(+)